MKTLKELLGEELYQQVVEKSGEHKLAIVSDGSWIPKDKFDAKLEDIKTLQGQITDRDTQLEELKKVDAEGLQAKIQELQTANDTTKTEYEAKLQQQSFDYALKDALIANKVRNPKALQALLNTESIKLDGDKLLGLDDQLTAIKESDPYLFDSEEKPPATPSIVVPGNPQGGNNQTGNDDPFAAKLAKWQ